MKYFICCCILSLVASRSITQCDLSFTASSTSVCGKEIVTFNVDNPNPNKTYIWDFGNTETAMGTQASTRYPADETSKTFVVTLQIDGDTTCTNINSEVIQVRPTPNVVVEASFDRCLPTNSNATTFTTEFCVGLGSGTYHWNFGDDSDTITSDESCLAHTYSGYNSYPVMVWQSNGSCADTFSRRVNFFKRPSADMNITENNIDVCEGDTVVIENGTTSNVAFFRINWGDGQVDQVNNTNNQKHVYEFDDDEACNILETAGSVEFDISLIAVAGENCEHSNESPVFVTPLPRPSFEVINCVCINDMPLQFSNTTCNSFNNTYVWNFDDPNSGTDNTSTASNPTHTFTAPGIYEVTLEATSTFSCGLAKVTQVIEIVGDPQASFEIEGYDGPVCESGTYILRGDIPTTNCVDFEWIVDESVVFLNETNKESRAPVILINQPGRHIIQLSVTNACDTRIIKDSIIYTAPPTIILPAITDSCGSASYLLVPQVADNGCTIESCLWTITNSRGEVVSTVEDSCDSYLAVFDVPDTYTVEFTATNCCGSSSASHSFTINNLPKAAASLQTNSTQFCTPDSILFINQSTFYDTLTWLVDAPAGWRFAPGSTAESESPQIIFEEAGTYPVQLRIQNSCAVDIWDTTIVYTAPPTISLQAISDSCNTAKYLLTPQISDNGCTIESCLWIFTDNTGEVVRTVEDSCDSYLAVFDEPGTYFMEFMVKNCCGTSSIFDTFTINNLPKAEVEVQIDSSIICAATSIAFTNRSTVYDSLIWLVDAPSGWSFSNGSSAQSESPEISFEEAGSYPVQLQIKNSCAIDTWDTTIIVYAAPKAIIDPIPDACGELNFQPLASIDKGGCADSHCSWTLFRDGNVIDSFSDCEIDPLTLNTPGSYRLELEVSNCCDSVRVVEDFIIQALENVSAGPDTSLCVGGTCLALPTSGTWIDESGREVLSFCPTQAGDFQLFYTQTLGLCSARDTMMITVNPLPDLEILTSQSSICVNADPVLLEASRGGVSWSSSGNGLRIDGLFDPQLAGPNLHLITATFTDSLGCSNSNSIQIKVDSIQSINLPDITLCESDQNVDLPAFFGIEEVGGSWEWNGNGIVDESNGKFNGFQAVADGNSPFLISYSFKTDANCVSTDTFFIDVTPKEAANIGVDQTVCKTMDFLQLTANLAGEWDWEGASQISPAGVVDLTETINRSYNVYFVAFEGESCETRDTLSLTVIDVTAVEAGPDLYVCETETMMNLSGFALPDNATGTWSGLDFENTSTGYFDLTVQNIASPTYLYYTAVSTIQSSCQASDSLLLTIQPLPEPDFDIIGEACQGNTIDLINNSQGANAYTWIINGMNEGATRDISYNFSPSGDYIIQLIAYSVSPINIQDTVCANTFVDTLHISSAPSLVDFTASAMEACANQAVTLTNLSQGENLNFSWYLNNSPTPFSTQTTGIVLPVLPSRTDQIYTIRLEVDNSCGGDIAENSVLIHPLPKADFLLTKDTFCSGELIPVSNLSYGDPIAQSWLINDRIVSTDILPSKLEIESDTTSTHMISLIIENTCGFDTLNQEIIVNPTDVTAFFKVSDDQVCIGDTIFITNGATFDVPVSYDFDNGVDFSLEPNTFIVYNSSGTYEIEQQASGCGHDTFQISVTVDSAQEVVFTIDSVACPGTPLVPDNRVLGAGFEWYVNENLVSEQGEPEIVFSEPGQIDTVRLVVMSSNGCRAALSQTVQVLTPLVSNFTYPETLCSDQALPFTNISTGNIINCLWNFGDGDTSNQKAPVHYYENAGSYIVQLIVDNGLCSNISTQRIDVYEKIQATTLVESIRCNGESTGAIQLDIQSGTGPFVYTWADGVEAKDRQDLPVGHYEVTITDRNACSWTGGTEIEQPEMGINLAVVESIPATCYGDADAFVAVDASGGTPGYQYQWGNLETDSYLLNIPAGLYDLTITDANNCEAAFQVEAKQNLALAVIDTVQQITCFGEADGQVQIDEVSGGIPPYLISLKGPNYEQTFEQNNSVGRLFDGLAAGSYSLTIQDSEGCSFETAYMITESSPISLDILQDDTLIQQGATVSLPYEHNIIDPTITWTPTDSLSCTDCTLPIARPAFQTQYTLTLIDKNGCSVTDQVMINIEASRDVFIPNTFTPDGSGFNDRFLIRSNNPGVVEVLEFKIFDRWGSILYEAFNFQPNDFDYGWDGTTLDGQVVQPGIYTYYADIQYYDTERKIWEGKVLLVR